MLGITYRAAWFMAHRLRYAMESGSLMTPLSGTVEVDEGYVGGNRKGGKGRRPADGGRKAAVAVLVERGGNVRAFPMERVDGASMTAAIKAHVAPGSELEIGHAIITSDKKMKTWRAEDGKVRRAIERCGGKVFFLRGVGLTLPDRENPQHRNTSRRDPGAPSGSGHED
jgi:hypothetical protein